MVRVAALVALSALTLPTVAAPPLASVAYGPWNIHVLQGGVGFKQALPAHGAVLGAASDWTMYAWVRPMAIPAGPQLIAGFGDPAGAARYFAIEHGKLAFVTGGQSSVSSQAAVQAGHWQFVAVVARHDHVSLFMDGRKVASGKVAAVAAKPQLVIGPVAQPWPRAVHFGGKVADFTIRPGVLDAQALAKLARHAPDALTRFAPAHPHWQVQTSAMVGQVTTQPPATLPKSRAPFSKPVATPPGPRPQLAPDGKNQWILGHWSLASATRITTTDGATISTTRYQPGKAWMAATVPGTVLTTLVDRGVYPDPVYGLNNMAIPESLNKHDWWYRSVFEVPADLRGKQLELTFNGINYKARVWVNGTRVGKIKGAFVQGRFDVTKLLRPGQRNVIAVRMSPPPNPGIPEEQSILGGPGWNGGMEALDGPTFIATEGWDWIPAIRDRDTGLWQNVTLRATGKVTLGATHVITRLPHPRQHKVANISIDVPLKNAGSSAVSGTLDLAFGNVTVSKPVTVPAGGVTLHLDPSNTPQLALHDPHLWWPNGYGQPYLYTLHVAFKRGGTVSDRQQFQFGVRQISYELSLFNAKGQLKRYLITPDKAKPGQRVVDVLYRAIHKTPHSWAYSLRPDALQSPAVKPLPDSSLKPYLAIRVNGVRIAVKGGSWGTDDFMKRVSRQRLEPYFKLARNAHIDVIRNWVGQSTEPVFYQLADKYGLLVLNDFWQSTQDDNLEPEDDALFLRNVAAVIKRYRNHPSILLWFGRNEGVPQALLDKRMDKTIAKLDGTRLYMPSSNRINLANSGPYNYRPPVDYFTKLAKGFAVEIGTMSFPTLEALKAMMPKADWWPISDDWAYHDWHQAGNGDTHGFMAAMARRFGKPDNLADFARKAQMMNYVNYRAIFEGFNAHLWTRDSGRLLWMTHPAWPSMVWQIYSSDYDTNAAYYGVMHACQPIHVQMNLPDHKVDVINNTTAALQGVKVHERVFGLDGQTLGQTSATLDAKAEGFTPALQAAMVDKALAAHKVVFVQLTLRDRDNRVLSRNFYWVANQPQDLQRLDTLPRVGLQVGAVRQADGALTVTVTNPSKHVALSTKLTLVDAQGLRVLPAFYSDNYLNLAPGQSVSVRITGMGAASLAKAASVEVRGWNAAAQSVSITTSH
ncbi:MAG TPA: LamG-like jellyroll fold domain-containing protein [Rhodanobacteraceae bacterium]